MLRSGTILMIREKAQGGKSAYAIGKELGISHVRTPHNKVRNFGAPGSELGCV